jgi:hypothetical protein
VIFVFMAASNLARPARLIRSTVGKERERMRKAAIEVLDCPMQSHGLTDHSRVAVLADGADGLASLLAPV